MRLMWTMVSVGGGILLAVMLYFLTDCLAVNMTGPGASVAKVVFWPVSVCPYLSGPGPKIGLPEKNRHEWTAVQDLAVAVGRGLSWTFYSSRVFVVVHLRGLVTPPFSG